MTLALLCSIQLKKRGTQEKMTLNQQQQQQQQQQPPPSQGQLGSKVATALAKAEARRQKRLARQAEVFLTGCFTIRENSLRIAFLELRRLPKANLQRDKPIRSATPGAEKHAMGVLRAETGCMGKHGKTFCNVLMCLTAGKHKTGVK